jgi:LPXTG-motif cell wall-anchored protein
MDAVQAAVTAAGLVLMAGVLLFFFGRRRRT